jgi:hypothetical protein
MTEAGNGERLGRIEVRLEVVERGVSNFREYQVESRDFMSWFRGREEEREKTDKQRSRIHFWLLGILSGVIVAGFAAIFAWAVSFEDRHHVSQTPTTYSQNSAQDAQSALPHN